MRDAGAAARASPMEVPTTYKLWVLGSKLSGVFIFAVGLEMLARGSPVWALALFAAGAAIVLSPVRGPGRGRTLRRGEGADGEQSFTGDR